MRIETEVHKVDAVIVGSGGAGLRAAIELPRFSGKFAILTKLYPMRSHTGTAQGGICAALGNREEDHWEWHMFDTVKGGDYLTDQDAAEILAQEAPRAIYELEHMGLPFNRTPDGKIDQRRFGGHTRDYGKAAVLRACYAADRTGHVILQTVYQQCLRRGVQFFDEFQMLDLIIEEGTCRGVVALELRTGKLHIFHARAVLLATGGYGRLWQITSNAMTLAGDGIAVAWRRGIPFEDPEFYQFHPTGIYKLGILLSEAVRGEGGILRNGKGERFMEVCAPTLKDLAPRDIVSRCIHKEIREGRGVGGKDYVHLDMTHLPPEVLEHKLPEVADFVRTYMGLDPQKEPVPIQPTAHYAMAGIPTDIHGQVVIDDRGTPLVGLFAAGECACVSVHGANRLGTNSLLDLLVFGRRAGASMASHITRVSGWAPLPEHPEERVRAEISAVLERGGRDEGERLRMAMQKIMMDEVSVIRGARGLEKARSMILGLRDEYRRIGVKDKGSCFNTELLGVIELGFQLDLALCTVEGALARTESRGAHWRDDIPERDDTHWLKHTLAHRAGEDRVELTYKPVTITRFQPMARKY